MIEFIKKYKFIIIIVLVFVVFLLFYFIREYIASKDIYTESYMKDQEYIMHPKVYEVNEYSLINITDEQMANIYLNDFRYNIYNEINSAYQLLNEEYRNKKFGTIDNFISYINNFGNDSFILREYNVTDGNNKIFRIYSKDGNLYIFKTSTDQHKMYNGKYSHAEGPTIPEPVDYIRE